ncbi:putative Trehalase [Cardiosporidium cionae]|uniref:Trehalase n=1 Tax=Cardiosporidium cionae TaxID=476202 RepID=A0ABQ7JES7_9APIC|nr:putative Trehalase [Cardiosporidium cionae]|eukprot:KAF8822515.1 putative Trehalase [Cardiosporidium cionae]
MVWAMRDLLAIHSHGPSPCGGVCNCNHVPLKHETGNATIDDLLCKDGPFLRVLQFSNLEHDSKCLLDRPLKVSPEIALESFYQLPDHSSETLSDFLNEYFDEAGSDLELWIPPDLPIDDPSFIRSSFLSPIEATTAHEAIKILGCLGRKVKKDQSCFSSLRRTLIDATNGFIIPGGRDSYWILRGLLISSMYDTARGMLENWCEIISRYGFIPNGLRRYYLDRSQPPVFSLMVANYYQATNDDNFVKKLYPYLQQEYNFWMDAGNKHIVQIEFDEGSFNVKHVSTIEEEISASPSPHCYILNRYYSDTHEPRPESYKEDYAIKKMYMHDPTYAKYLMQCLRAGGESGWDFSSRWYKVSERSRWSLQNIDTLNVIPIDLNTLMYLLEKNLAKWASLQTNKSEGDRALLKEMYETAAERRREAMLALMCDYLCRERSLSAIPNLASVWPLWAGLTDNEKDLELATSFLVHHSGLWREWGLAPTAINSGQQWDLPNGWLPLTQVALEFFITSSLPDARLCGIQMLESCLTSIVEGKLNSGCFFEKYSTEICGSRGSGGEYVTQVGFGWTNGVIIEWIKYKAHNYDIEAVKHILLADFKSDSSESRQ